MDRNKDIKAVGCSLENSVAGCFYMCAWRRTSLMDESS